MNFKSAASVAQVVLQMKLADLPRSRNRALINDLFNGLPPYTDQEAQQNRIEVNVNFLEGANAAHQARQQFSNAFLSPARFFGVTLDCGPVHRRRQWGEIITTEINKQMKRSRAYRETLRNVFGQVVLHGIGPVTWDGPERWTPTMHMLCDVLMPSKTLLSMDNVDYFAVYRRYTASRLWQMTHGPAVDSGWNTELAEQCVNWAKQQVGKSSQNANDLMYSPERLAEDIKADSGLYSSDATPTIDCWDMYYRSDSDDGSGWERRMILDYPTSADGVPGDPIVSVGKSQFLYDSGSRLFASRLDEIAHFQFADGNQVAPFRYHSVRSLGWLLYAVCHLQNRLRCKLNEHAFENLLQYFRVANPDDMERLQKVDLIDKGIIPDGLSMVPQTERWQINEGLAEAVISLNRQSMQANSSSYTQDYESRRQQSGDKTATEVMAEVNASSALVSAMLQEAYGYQEFQYAEICRRFCIPNSKDAAVRSFRAACISQGVPEEYLKSDKWTVKAERVMGGGNKQLEIAQAKMLLEVLPRLDPSAQRIVLRNYAFAVTSDAALTEQLVPLTPEKTTDTVHDAQLASAALMMGLPVSVKTGYNHIEYIETLLAAMAATVHQIETQTGGMPSQEQVAGLINTAKHIEQHIAILAQDPEEKPRVKEYADDLGQLQNLIKGYQQRLAEQSQQQPGASEADAKIAQMQAEAETAMRIAEAKANQKLEQTKAKHELQMANTIRKTEVSEAALDVKTAAEIRREGLKASAQPAETAATE